MILKMFHVKHFSSSLKPFAKLFGATQSPAFFRLILKMFHVTILFVIYYLYLDNYYD